MKSFRILARVLQNPRLSQTQSSCSTLTYRRAVHHLSTIRGTETGTRVTGNHYQGKEYCVDQRRNFMKMLHSVYNGLDSERLKEVGADRLCAEWVLKCGGKVRFQGQENSIEGYNDLPESNFDKYKIEELDFTGTTAMVLGFLHLHNLKNVKRVKIDGGPYISDSCVSALLELKGSLEQLEIRNCHLITTQGLITTLVELKKLKNLVLRNLPGIVGEHRDAFLKHLQQYLPKCKIDFMQF